MKYYRIETGGGPTWAREEAGTLHLLNGTPFTGTFDRDERVPLAEARLLAPVHASKVVAIGLNYRDHAAERGKAIPEEPLMFLKPPSAIVGPGDTIRRPPWAGRVDHEAEMGIVIGREAKDIESPEAALQYILGATCVNDVTARDLQAKDVQFGRAKGFDTFCPVGPCIATGIDFSALAIAGRVNGEVRQQSNTAQLIFSPGYLVWFVARVMTLLPGDIISTGTPAGIGPLDAGDVIEVEIEGIGILRNPVA